MLSSQNLERDLEWYKSMLGFEVLRNDRKSALIRRDEFFIHLQKQSPDSTAMIGGSVVKFFVDDIISIFQEYREKKLLHEDQLVSEPASSSLEFELFDPSGNTIIFVKESR